MKRAHDDIDEAVIQLVSSVLRNPVEVHLDTDLADAGMSSMDTVRLVAQCEDAFDLEIEPEHMIEEHLRTPARIVRLLKERYLPAA